MSGDDVFAYVLVAMVWFGWPLWRLSNDINALRKIAEKGRRP